MNVVNTDRHEGRRLRGFRDGRANENAVIQAEIRRLVSAIRPFGVFNKDALAHKARAEHWREGGLDRALNASVDEGLLEDRPFGFYNESSRKNRATGSPRCRSGEVCAVGLSVTRARRCPRARAVRRQHAEARAARRAALLRGARWHRSGVRGHGRQVRRARSSQSAVAPRRAQPGPRGSGVVAHPRRRCVPAPNGRLAARRACAGGHRPEAGGRSPCSPPGCAIARLRDPQGGLSARDSERAAVRPACRAAQGASVRAPASRSFAAESVGRLRPARVAASRPLRVARPRSARLSPRDGSAGPRERAGRSRRVCLRRVGCSSVPGRDARSGLCTPRRPAACGTLQPPPRARDPRPARGTRVWRQGRRTWPSCGC